MQKNIIITLILSVFIAVFAILNAGAVPVNLIFTTVNLSAALVILISACVGAVIVYLMDTVSKLKIKKTIKENEKTIVRMNSEYQTLTDKYEDSIAELKVLKEQIEIINDNQEIVSIQE